MKSRADTASIKVQRDFLLWLKQKAAARGAFVYEILEEMVARGVGSSPWRDVAPKRTRNG